MAFYLMPFNISTCGIAILCNRFQRQESWLQRDKRAVIEI